MEGKIFLGIKKVLHGVKANVLLKNFTTYKIGGPGKYFFVAKNKEDLIKALKTAKDFNLPFFILGGGSNILVSDKGFNGLVVQIRNSKFEIRNSNEVYTGAGVALKDLVNFTADAGLSGLEWAAGIPGITVGGAVYGHAQAFGEKISDNIKTVEAINSDTLKIKIFSEKECRFSLKNSIFKKSSSGRKKWAIVSAVLKFKKKHPEEIKSRIEENINYRKGRHPVNFPSAGSVFVNPETAIKDKNLLIKFPELMEYNNKGVIPAGYLISRCGLAGKKIGKVQISEKHGNFIINLGGGKAKDVLALIELARQKVKKTFNIDLKLEAQLVGF